MTPTRQQRRLVLPARWSMARAAMGLTVLLACASLLACGASVGAGTPAALPGAGTERLRSPEPRATEVQSTATALPRPSPTVTPPAPLAATVNGEYVFLADLERQMVLYEQAMVGQGLELDAEERQAHLAEVQRDVLAALIDYVLIRQESAAMGVELNDAEIEAQLESDIAIGGGQEAFQEWLRVTGQTRDDYLDLLRRSMLSQRVLEMVIADVPATAEQVHARHIVVDSEAAAQEILSYLAQGADFADVARQQSLDLATSGSGGDLGWFPRGIVAPELEDVAFALDLQQISEVVRVGEGFHIIQVLEREPNRPLSTELWVDHKLANFEEWLSERRAEAAIEWFVDP